MSLFCSHPWVATSIAQAQHIYCFASPWSPHFFSSRPWLPQPSAQFEVWIWPHVFLFGRAGNGKFGENRLCARSGVAKAVAQFLHFLCLASLGRHNRCAISAPVFFAAPLPRSSPPLSSFHRCFPGAISAATCCAIPTHGFLAPLSRHIHCVVATHLSTSSPLGRHIRCAISTSVFLSPPFVATI